MNILKVNNQNPNRETIKQAARSLINNNLIIYPTDTAYGLGGNALNLKTIKKIYNIKKRDPSKPTHVIVRDWEMIKNLTYTNPFAKKLFNKFLPGPLTIILKKKRNVPDILTSHLPSLGIRIPNNKITNILSHLVDFPYTTPSANLSGDKTPYSINDINENLLDKVDVILDAGRLLNVKPSTIIDTSQNIPTIIRQGPITIEELERTIKTKVNCQN